MACDAVLYAPPPPPLPPPPPRNRVPGVCGKWLWCRSSPSTSFKPIRYCQLHMFRKRQCVSIETEGRAKAATPGSFRGGEGGTHLHPRPRFP